MNKLRKTSVEPEKEKRLRVPELLCRYRKLSLIRWLALSMDTWLMCCKSLPATLSGPKPAPYLL